MRKALAPLTAPVLCTCCTPLIRPIMAGAVVGSSAVAPVRLWPLLTVSRLVPSWLISSSRPAWEEADRPSTATMAATPMAIPSADSPARSFRVRSPTVESRARSESCSRSGPGWRSVTALLAGRADAVRVHGRAARERRASAAAAAAGVGDDAAVEDLDLAGHPLGDGVVVGDDHDRRAGLVELVDQGQDRLPGGLVEVPGRLVGEHDGGLADEGPGDRDPLALPARELGGTDVGALGQADQIQGVEGALATLP